MSHRWGRALLRLYPSRIRRRYGDELLELQDQLRAEGELSRGRLIRDALVGALLARSVRQRASVLGAVAVLVAVVVAGVEVTGSHHRVRGPRILNAAFPLQLAQPVLSGQRCVSRSGHSCSLQACSTRLTARARMQTVEDHAAQAASSHQAQPARAACTPTVSTLWFISDRVPQNQQPTTSDRQQ